MSEERSSGCGQTESIEAKITKYEHFVNDVLRRDLNRAAKRQEMVANQLADWRKVKAVIEAMAPKEPLKVLTDLGSNFYVQCRVTNPRRIYVKIGLGLCLEMEPEEALRFAAKRERQLSEELARLCAQSAAIKGHIGLVVESIGRLSAL